MRQPRMPFLIAVALAAGTPTGVLAQATSSPTPRLEVGVQVSAQTGDLHGFTWSPRLTLNLFPLSAVEATADLRQSDIDPFGVRTTGQGFALHLRQTLWTHGRWQVFGIVGAGSGRTTFDEPSRTITTRTGTLTVGPQRYVDSGSVFHVGSAVQFEAASHLAARADIRAALGDSSGLRAMVGGVVPVGRFRAGTRPVPSSKNGEAPDGWSKVARGREVWLTTTSGEVWFGEVEAISDTTVTLRRQSDRVTVALVDVQSIEGRDGVANGIAAGAAGGAVTGAVTTAVLAALLCEVDNCLAESAGAVVAGSAIGTALGVVIGAVVDGLIPGRQTLVGRPSTVAVRRTPASQSPAADAAPHLALTAGVSLTSQWDDETFLGRGPLLSVGVSTPLARRLRLEGELSLARHHRDSGYLEANGTPIAGTARVAWLFLEPTRAVRPFVSGGLTLTHHRGEFVWHAVVPGPGGLPVEGATEQRAWRLTKGGWETGGGIEVHGTGRIWWRPEVRLSSTFGDSRYRPGFDTLATPVLAIRSGLVVMWQ